MSEQEKQESGKKKGHKPANQRYKTEQRWVRNRARRIARHCARHPKDAKSQLVLRNEKIMPNRITKRAEKRSRRPTMADRKRNRSRARRDQLVSVE